MPSETFTHSAIADVPADTVWEALDEPTTWESIAGVDRVYDPKIDPEGKLIGFIFDTVVAGKKYVGTATPDQRVEGRVMSWNVRNSEISGVTRVELEPEGATTRITVTLQVSSAGFLSGMFFPVITSTIGNGLPQTVEDFAAAFSATAG